MAKTPIAPTSRPAIIHELVAAGNVGTGTLYVK